jgi:O-antigen/teichoic acid export membrane protein
MPARSPWRSAAPLVLGRAGSAVIGFLLPVVLARQLDATDYGTYKQVYLVANTALYALQLGFAQSLFYFVPRSRSEDERRAYIGQTQVMLALIGLVTFLGLFVASPAMARFFDNPQLADLALPLALLAGALIAAAPFEITLTARGKPGSSGIIMVCSDITRIVAMLLAIKLGYGIRGLTWAAALAAIARWLACVALAGGARHLRLRPAAVRQQMSYSLPFGVAACLLYVQQQLHLFYVSHQTAPSVFALYTVGCMQIPIVGLLYAPMAETLQVRLGVLERSGEAKQVGHAFAETVDRLALIFLPLCVLLIVTARPGLHVLFGGRYDDAAGIMRVAVLSVAVASLPVDGVLKARAKTRTLMWMYAVKLAVTWPLVAVGYRLHGLDGAIGAHVLVELLTKVAQMVLVGRDLHIPVGDLLGGRGIVRSLLVAAIAGVTGGAAVGVIPRTLASVQAFKLPHTGPGRLLFEPDFWACAAAGILTALVVVAEMWMRRPAPASVAPPVAEPEERTRMIA